MRTGFWARRVLSVPVYGSHVWKNQVTENAGSARNASYHFFFPEKKNILNENEKLILFFFKLN